MERRGKRESERERNEMKIQIDTHREIERQRRTDRQINRRNYKKYTINNDPANKLKMTKRREDQR